MTEKDMVLDILEGVKASIGTYAKIITETSDLNLRQTFQQMRNNDEQFQYDLFKIADKKGYYIPAPKETLQNCQDIKAKLTKALTEKQGAGPIPVLK